MAVTSAGYEKETQILWPYECHPLVFKGDFDFLV